jgi:FG-GAP-like repeat
MTPSAQRANCRPLLIATAIAILGLVVALVPRLGAQRTAAPAVAESAPTRFVEITSRLHLALPPIVHSSGHSSSSSSSAVTLSVSIRSQDYSLEYARRMLVPVMGGSIAVGDFDGDGHPDLYAVVPGSSNHLFQNRADGTFVEVTDKAKVAGTGADLGAAFGDFDKSGHASLFVAGLGGVTLYHNNGDGTFTDTTEKAGLKSKPGELATSVLLFDADNDGFLDVLVTIYTDLSTPPSKPSFTFPNDFAGANSRLYRNQHDGTFAEITEAAGLTVNPGRTHMAVAADFNHNGRQDLLLLRDNKPPALFRNQGQGKFEDHTWDAGGEIWKYAYVDAQTGDFNHDGKTDAVLWSTVGNEVLINQGDGKFDQDDSLPLVYAANRAFGFHGMAADLNGDGYEDFLTVDDKGKWHFIVNHEGHFKEAPFAWTMETAAAAEADSKASTPPALASMTAVRLGKSTELCLVALTMDGQVEIFERARNPVARNPADHAPSVAGQRN